MPLKEGVHVVTVNDYLARRDSEDMGRVFKFLGLSVGLIAHALDYPDRKAAYAHLDITLWHLITSSVLIICVIICRWTKDQWYNGL